MDQETSNDGEGLSMERAVPTYYPGDRVALRVEIEHRTNFRWVEAVFGASSAWLEDPHFREHTARMRSSDVSVQEERSDGTKRSVVHFDIVANGEWLSNRVVYELSELRAETVGELAGEGTRGSGVELSIDHLQHKPRFLYEGEAGSLTARVVEAELL
jgi:hypothetical protein